jgi:DNA processing protein
MNENLKFWFALNKVPGLGPVRLKKLLDQYSSAAAACAALGCPVPEIDDDLQKLSKIKARALSLEDPAYPLSLKNIHDPPPILYVKGALWPEDTLALAIVGTRRASPYGLEIAGKIAFELAQRGLTIVSGLALGIDAAAHEGALRAGGRTIAVLGSGIDRIAPQTNVALAGKIEERGAVVSEFPLGQEPDRWTFPQRNRIISGLSLGVIVVEGHYDSGAMITAKQALEQGREVFAVPGDIGLEQSKGPHWLIKQGAKLIENVEDVLEELKYQIPNNKLQTNPDHQITKIKPENLSPDEEKIFSLLSDEPKQLDAIACEAGWPVQQASACLTLLEIKKLARQLPGKMFATA